MSVSTITGVARADASLVAHAGTLAAPATTQAATMQPSLMARQTTAAHRENAVAAANSER